jgi:hypothetical protein
MLIKKIPVTRNKRAFLAGWILSFAVIFSGCAGRYFHEIPLAQPPFPINDLSRIKFRESWYGVIFNSRKIGFAHFRIDGGGGDNHFRIESEIVIQFKLLGVGKEISFRELCVVDPDLSLRSFSSDMDLGGTRRRVHGEVTGENLKVTIETENSQETQSITLTDRIYPGAAMYFYPVLKGLEIGREYSYAVYSPETLSVEKVFQKVKAYEVSDLFEGPAFKIENSLGGINSDCWIDPDRGMLLEMAMHGSLIYDREDELSAKRFIYQESISKNDLLLDYSLVKTDKPIPHPREVKFLEVEIAGLDEDGLVISDAIQKAIKNRGVVKYVISTPLPEEDKLILPIEHEKFRPYLKPSASVQSDNKEIVAQSHAILQGEKSALKGVKILTDWVAQEIKESMTDSFSSLDVLHKKEGECQAHAYLYTALARAAGIPTKVVSGLVYLEGYGFLYHSWAESYIGFWVPVDPTFGQVPVDATHIKLVEGEKFEDLSRLVNVIGRIKAKVGEWK